MWTATKALAPFTKATWDASDYKAFAKFDRDPGAPLQDGQTMVIELFQPKWQPNDYYYNNFRVNKNDEIRPSYSYSTDSVEKYETPVAISTGATALGASALAMASLLYTF